MASFAFLSTFPPTRCGLATFTQSLAAAITASGIDSARIVRVVDDLDELAPAVVGSRTTIAGELRPGDPRSIREAARILSQSDVIVVQHEYGIYGGPDGDEVLEVLAALTTPAIVVLHTVLAEPTAHQREVLERVAALASSVVVMTETARTLLASGYRVDLARVSIIPHGVPEWDVVPSPPRTDRRTMLTWGLIGPGKGLEWGIRAVAALGDVVPPVHYEILGETHPKVVVHEGEVYRERLVALAAELGIADRVTFDARYLDDAGLAEHIAAADVVLLPYDSRTQVTSGVLVEALSAGKPVVATAFPHARELLVDGVGSVVEHESPSAIAAAVRDTLARVVRVAPQVTPPAVRPQHAWSEVADSYRLQAVTLAPTARRSA